ncbi:MAG: M24 family metallopeptidase [Defluviitaleaceae bacterium]|nr:M24 family metallopeptidase [Defluviitaleaceae bacterium]
MCQRNVLPLKEQWPVRDARLLYRLENLLPRLMREEGIDMWIVTSQENNEDPVMKTLLPAPAMTSGRRTILVFHLKNDGVLEKLCVNRAGGMGSAYTSVWLNCKGSDISRYMALSGGVVKNDSPPEGPPETQMECLARVINERNPAKIGMNFSEIDHHGYGDGLSHGAYKLIAGSIGAENAAKIVSASRLCVRWLETRSPEEITTFKGVVEFTAEIMREAFSRKVVHPGVTTASWLEAWIMQRCEDMGLKPWFPFYIVIRREGSPGLYGDTVIQEGDVIHCDMGIEYLGLCSDLQCNAYVLKKGESAPPTGITALFEQGKRMQDIVTGEFKVGRTGNEILAESVKKSEAEGISGMVYTHPIGFYGHSPGAGIGYIDNQKSVKYWGEHPIYNDTAYALELNVAGPIPEWGGSMLMLGIETDVIFTGGKIEYYYRQNELFLL